MKKLREVFRLKFEFGYSHRQIADSVGISPGTVSVYLDLLKVSGLVWSELKEESDEQLEQRIFRHPAKGISRPHPDWAEVRLELQKKGVTLLLLWNEYRKDNPDGLGYTQFTKYYKRYAKTLDPVMHFVHKAGEKTFVDYAGLTMEWLDPKASEVHKAQVFVGCLGSSSLIFAEATESQSLPDWIGSHVRMFEAFGGVTKTLIPDNLKSGITKSHRYDPDINPTYHQMALHYDIAVVPARVVRPRDKAKVESAVQIVERSIIAPLRHQTFLSLHELNQAIKTKLNDLNNKPMQRIDLSRKEQFEEIEKPALRPLPSQSFELLVWKKAKVHIDYHIFVDKHFYSVPHKLIGSYVDVAVSRNRIEVFHQSTRVAVHQREDRPNQFTTLEAHMPKAHSAYLNEERDASVVRLMQWAKTIGPNAGLCIEQFFKSRHFPQQAIRAVLGLRRLAQQNGAEAFEKACEQANHLHQYRYRTVESILKHRLYETEAPTTKTIGRSDLFRGPSYFKGEQSC
jgi:transposase